MGDLSSSVEHGPDGLILGTFVLSSTLEGESPPDLAWPQLIVEFLQH